jgi:hypothetical protein
MNDDEQAWGCWFPILLSLVLWAIIIYIIRKLLGWG